MARRWATNLDLLRNQIQNALAHILAADPGGPDEGQFWYNSTTKTWNFRTNTTNINLGRLDQISAPTASVSLNSQKITSLADGTVASDGVNLGQLQAFVRGLDWKASVRAATTAAGTLATAFENGDAIDGVTLATGDRILIKDQAAPETNGIYTVNASGAPTRAVDADASAEVTAGLTVWVEEGTANGDKSFTLTTDGPITLGTTPLDFALSGSAPSSSGSVSKFADDIGDTSTLAYPVVHSLGTTDVIVQLYDNDDDNQIEADVEITDANTVTVTFTVAPDTDQIRVVVLG